jgi:hypothetical protein
MAAAWAAVPAAPAVAAADGVQGKVGQRCRVDVSGAWLVPAGEAVGLLELVACAAVLVAVAVGVGCVLVTPAAAAVAEGHSVRSLVARACSWACAGSSTAGTGKIDQTRVTKSAKQSRSHTPCQTCLVLHLSVHVLRHITSAVHGKKTCQCSKAPICLPRTLLGRIQS